MKRFFKSLALGILLSLPWVGAQAQQVNPYCTQSTAPPWNWAPCNPNNALAVTASVSASITGFPGTTQTTGTPSSAGSIGTAVLRRPTIPLNSPALGFDGTLIALPAGSLRSMLRGRQRRPSTHRARW